MFSGVYWNQPGHPLVCLCLRVSVCELNTNFCQTPGRGIKSHLVTALVFPAMLSIISSTNFLILATLEFLSVNALNSIKCKILFCGKDLTLSQMTNFRLFQTRSWQTTVPNFMKMAVSSTNG